MVEVIKNEILNKRLNIFELDEIMQNVAGSPGELAWLDEDEVLKDGYIAYQIPGTDKHYNVHFNVIHPNGEDEGFDCTTIEITDIKV